MENGASSSSPPDKWPPDDKLQKVKEMKFMEELRRAWSANLPDLRSLDMFMEEADDHPYLAWLHALQSRGELKTFGLFSLDDLLKDYPDVLQRVLLRDSFLVSSLSRSGYSHGDDGGALNAAVLRDHMGFLKLLAPSNSVNAHEDVLSVLRLKIKNSEKEDLYIDGFQAIRRALLWRHLKEQFAKDARRPPITTFLKELSRSVRYGDSKILGRLIEQAPAMSLDSMRRQGKDISDDPWGVVLLWAVACDQPHIVGAFKDRQGDLFNKITENVERCTNPEFADLLRNPGNSAELLRSPSNFANLLRNPWISDHERSRNDLIYLLEITMAMVKGDVQRRSSTMNNCFHDMPNGIVQARFNLFQQRTKDTAWTPLHLAAVRGHSGAVECLLTAYPMEGCEFSKKDDQCLADLRTSLEFGFFDRFWMTPLHYAVRSERKSAVMVRTLLRSVLFQPHVTDVDIFKRTALHVACGNGATGETIRALLASTHVDVNAQDCCLFTPLHWAVYAGATNAGIVLLEEASGSRNIRSKKNRDGKHPYKMAVYKRIKEAGKGDESLQRDKRKGRGNGETIELEFLLQELQPVKEEVDRLYRDRQVYVDAANAILVGAALIASVTFAGWLQPPWGDKTESTSEIRVYWVFNSLSFFFSVATLTAGAAAVLPVENYIEDAVASIRRWLVLASALLLVCILFVLGAFASAGFASLSSVPKLENHMIITTTIGSILCGLIALFFLFRLCKIRPDWLTKKKLISKIQGVYPMIRSGKSTELSRSVSEHVQKLVESVPNIFEQWDMKGQIYNWHAQLRVHDVQQSYYNVQMCRKMAEKFDMRAPIRLSRFSSS